LNQRLAESLISDYDSSPTPKIFLISYSDSDIFKVRETNSRGGGEDTTFETKAKGSEKARGQGQGPICRRQVRCFEAKDRKAEAKDSRTRLKIRANINVNIVIMISHAFKRKIV